jgi:hypothetical protein
VHPKIVQELLGHATIAMTLDNYSHYLPSMGIRRRERWEMPSDSRVTVR